MTQPLLHRFLREPMLHFALLGGLIFILFAAFDDERGAPAETIIISSERIAQLTDGFRSVWKRVPTQREIDGLIEEDIREEVYYREALALGLDRNDTIVRRRMRQKMEFLIDTGTNLLVPAAAELEAYFAENKQYYERRPRLALEQLYLGTAPQPQMIDQTLSTLQSGLKIDPSELGEPSLLPVQLGLSTSSSVDGVFGTGFFDLLWDFTPGEWSGPVTSAYGSHLVRLLDKIPPRTPSLDEIRDVVTKNWRENKAQEIKKLDYDNRRENYIVEMENNDAQTAVK